MVSTVANTLFNHLIDAFPADRPYSREDLSLDPMPRAVAEYVEHLMAGRMPQIGPIPANWFDVEHPDVKEARRAFVDAVLRHQRIPGEDWQEVLLTACRESVAYLVKPSITLTRVVFADESGPATSETVFSRMKPFKAYPYFHDVVAAYFDQKQVDTIDRERFGRLLRRIDHQVTSDYGVKEWLGLLEPLTSLLARVPGYSDGLPVELLKAFFVERQADELVRRIDLRFAGLRLFSEEQLKTLFEDDVEGMSEQPQAVPAVHSRDARSMDARAPERPRDPVPLWKQFEPGQPATSAQDVQPSPTPGEPLWKQFRNEPASNAAPSDLTVLERTVLGDRGALNRDLFVAHLFAGSREEYEKTLLRLRTARTWSQASQVIAQEVFLKHQVNIYSDPAVAFTDAAEAQYRD